MLRKIVHMLMGAPAAEVPTEQTHFEALLARVRERVAARLNSETDPLELLAREVMREVVGVGGAAAGRNFDAGGSNNAQAARAFFSVLVENDRLPAGEQLDEGELTLLKNLLVEYFSGADAVRARANEVLALIERKFSQGAFTQARILLQIFETDGETRLNNERNLFYEDMIMRLGTRRRHEIPDLERDQIRSTLAELRIAQDDEVKKALVWLGREYYVHLCLAVRDPAQVEIWGTLAQKANTEAAERLLRYVPPRRWRSPASLPTLDTLAASERHLSDEVVKHHVQRLLKMCYFLLLASGDTGYEAFIYSFLDWSRQVLGIEAKNLLPVIHRRSVLDEVGLQETLDAVFEEHYALPLAERVQGSSQFKSLENAWNALFARLARLDINDVPPGHYDVGGFLLDELLDFEQPEPYFGFKLYRLT